MAANIGQGTAIGATEYLESIVTKGRASSGAIQPLKIAFSKVLSVVDGQGWGATVVAKIDVDDYMTRFGNLTRGKYTDRSLAVYRVRVSKVVEWYNRFMDNPGWMPNIQSRAPRGSKSAPAAAGQPLAPIAEAPAVAAGPPADIRRPELTAYPFPLQHGLLAELYLPSSLSQHDANRLAAFVQALVVEEPLS